MSTPAPGWYPDPAGSPKYRYWDGQNWTDQLRGREQSPPQQPAAQPQPRQQAVAQAPQQARQPAPEQSDWGQAAQQQAPASAPQQPAPQQPAPQQPAPQPSQWGQAAQPQTPQPQAPAPQQPTPSWDNAPQQQTAPPVSSAPGVAAIPTAGSPQMAATAPGAPTQTAHREVTGYGRRFLGAIMAGLPVFLPRLFSMFLPDAIAGLVALLFFVGFGALYVKGLADHGKGFHFGHYTVGSAVVSDDGTPGIGWGKAVLRELVLKPLGMIFLGVGAFWVFIDADNRALWDVILGTRVVDVAEFGEQMKDRHWVQAVFD